MSFQDSIRDKSFQIFATRTDPAEEPHLNMRTAVNSGVDRAKTTTPAGSRQNLKAPREQEKGPWFRRDNRKSRRRRRR